MEKENWSPDPEVLRLFEERIKQLDCQDVRIALGSRILTWSGILEEVRQGTNFGRGYYKSLLESSLMDNRQDEL